MTEEQMWQAEYAHFASLSTRNVARALYVSQSCEPQYVVTLHELDTRWAMHRDVYAFGALVYWAYLLP